MILIFHNHAFHINLGFRGQKLSKLYESAVFISTFSDVRFGHLSRRALFMMASLLSLSLSQPLVLDQDCMTLSSRDLRLEKRTLFRYSKIQQAVKVNAGLEILVLK